MNTHTIKETGTHGSLFTEEQLEMFKRMLSLNPPEGPSSSLVDRIESTSKTTPVPYKDWKVKVVGENKNVCSLFLNKGCYLTNKEQEANVIVFTGGPCVTPILYGEFKHITTKCNLKRDLEEVRLFKSLHPEKIKIGICRGAQLLNVMCGGSMWQDVNNHRETTHKVLNTLNNQTYEVNSTHHQMMKPNRMLGYEYLVARESTMKHGIDHTWQNESAPTEDFYDDCEGVYYEHMNALCFQPHPEYNHLPTSQLFWEVCNELIDWSYHHRRQSIKQVNEKRRA